MKKLVLILIPFMISLGATAEVHSKKDKENKREEKQRKAYEKREAKKLQHKIETHDIRQKRRKMQREKNIKVSQIMEYKKKETKADKKALRKKKHVMAMQHKHANKTIKHELASADYIKTFHNTSSKRRKKVHTVAFHEAKRKTAYARRHDMMAIVVK